MAGGELRAGTIVAARFSEWQVAAADEALGTDAATIHTGPATVLDTFRWVSGPLDLWLDCGSAWWVWRQVTGQDGVWRTRSRAPEIRVK